MLHCIVALTVFCVDTVSLLLAAAAFSALHSTVHNCYVTFLCHLISRMCYPLFLFCLENSRNAFYTLLGDDGGAVDWVGSRWDEVCAVVQKGPFPGA